MYHVAGEFTARELGLDKSTRLYAASRPTKGYRYLPGLPVQNMNQVCSALRSGSDYGHIINGTDAKEFVWWHHWPSKIEALIGWDLQGLTPGAVSDMSYRLKDQGKKHRDVERQQLWRFLGQ